MKCPCEGQNPVNLREVVKCVEPTLFHRVDRPASLGDDTATSPDQLDYKNVLLVYEANGHAYLYSSDGIPTFISYTKSDTDIHELEEAIAELQTDLANETLARNDADLELRTEIEQEASQREEADTNLQNQIDSLSGTEVQTDTTVSGDASTVTVTKTTGPLDGNQIEVALPLPVASETAAGVMNAATFNAVQENAENIDSILGGAVLIEGLPENISQTDLTQAWKDATGKTELINRASIFDADNNRVWYYYENAHEWKPISTDGTEVNISLATNDTPGIVKGSTEDGQVAVEADGSMSLNGYDGMQHDIENLSQLVAGIEVPKLPNSMVYDFVSPAGANNPSTADNANITARVVNTTTGNVTNATLMMPMASGTQAGSITAGNKQKLDNLPAITSIGENLELTDEGVLNATGGGEVEVPKVPTEIPRFNFNITQGYRDFSTGGADGSWRGWNMVDYNTETGQETKFTLKATAATVFQAGLMSSTDKRKLDSLLEIKSLNDSLSLDENGQLSVVGDGGGGSSKGPIYSIGTNDLTNTLVYWTRTTTTVRPTFAGVNTSTGETYEDEGDALLGASSTRAGLMVAADKKKLDSLGVGSITNMDGVLQSETEVQIEFARANLTTGAAETQTATIEAATSEEAGVMLASDKVKLDAIPTLTEMQWARTGNLPPAVVTGFEDTTYGTDTITMHLDTKDLATGGVSVQELMLEAATANTAEAGGQAGIMTAFQATQLAAVAARPQMVAATADEITAAWEAA